MKKPRTIKAMREFLEGHFTYEGCFARNVKINRLAFPDANARDRAYSLVYTDDAFREVRALIREFAARHDHRLQVFFSGRSGGYLVLHYGGRRTAEHKSVCTVCGQKNFKAVLPEAVTAEDKLMHYLAGHNHWIPEVYPNQSEVQALGFAPERVVELIKTFRSKSILVEPHGWVQLKDVSPDNQCGCCRENARVNRKFYESYTNNRKTACENFSEMDKASLASIVEDVMAFDRLTDDCVAAFVAFCAENEAVEETVMVPEQVMVARPL